MTELQEKQLAFLDETVEYYSADTNRRCVNGNMCYYSPKTARKESVSEGCAVGRHLPADFANYLDGRATIISVHGIFGNPGLYAKLPDELKELGKDFLGGVQRLHDVSENWNANGLTKQGKRAVEVIKRNIELGLPSNG